MYNASKSDLGLYDLFIRGNCRREELSVQEIILGVKQGLLEVHLYLRYRQIEYPNSVITDPALYVGGSMFVSRSRRRIS
jgi:hypothetical protein